MKYVLCIRKIKMTKYTHKTKDRVTRTPLKTGDELRCSGRVRGSCSTSEVSIRLGLQSMFLFVRVSSGHIVCLLYMFFPHFGISSNFSSIRFSYAFSYDCSDVIDEFCFFVQTY
jgi:hypothetical protein